MSTDPPPPSTEYEGRKDLVQRWQLFYNMTPRSDSRLTHLFANQELDPCVTADQVARELLATDFIYKNTLYGEVIEEFMRGVADELRRVNPDLAWKDTWDIVRFYGPHALKLMCLSASGLRIPQHM